MKNLLIASLILNSLLLQGIDALAQTQTLDLVSQNLNRLFDDRDDGNGEKIDSSRRYRQRLQQIAGKVAQAYRFPDVIALQEVENRAILLDIGHLLDSKYQQSYRAILLEGNDRSGIDVGFLVKSQLRLKSVRQLYANEPVPDHGYKLFSRPPLVIELCQNECVTLVNLHLRSMKGLKNKRKNNKVMLKRRLQSEKLAVWVEQFQRRWPHKKLILTGDFNALSPSDRYVDTLGTILGKPDQSRPVMTTADLIRHDLIDLTRRVPEEKRYSYSYRGKKQVLDYILVNRHLENKVDSINFSAIDQKFSDHAAISARFTLTR